jgi:putative oxidoreductase
MKIAILIVRVVLGLAFLAFGLLGLFHPMSPAPNTPPDAITLGTILAISGWMKVVQVLMILAGLLLLVGRYVPLALVMLGPILVNILLFHLTLEGGHGILPGAILTVFELFLIWAYRLSFRGLFDAAPEVS